VGEKNRNEKRRGSVEGEEAEVVIAGSSEALFEQLRERGPNPRVVEREPEPSPQLTEESSSDNGQDLNAASGDPTTAELPDTARVVGAAGVYKRVTTGSV
jgi:hypothetical protein